MAKIRISHFYEKFSFLQDAFPTILQRLDTGAEWNPISLNKCRNLKNPVQPHKGDLCIKASASGISGKQAGLGDSGGPLYITHEKRVPEKMVGNLLEGPLPVVVKRHIYMGRLEEIKLY